MGEGVLFGVTNPDTGNVWRFQKPDSWKWKGLPRQWKQAVCSCPDQQNEWGHRWVFSQVDFSSDPASLVGDMGTSARIDWHLIEWGKTQSFNSEWDVVDGQEGMCVGGILEVFAQDEVTIFFF